MKIFQKIYSLVYIFFIFLIITFLFNIISQLFKIKRVLNEINYLEKDIKTLEEEEKFFASETKKLDTDAGIEEYARKKLDMIKKEERLYKIIVDKDGKKNKK